MILVKMERTDVAQEEADAIASLLQSNGYDARSVMTLAPSQTDDPARRQADRPLRWYVGSRPAQWSRTGLPRTRWSVSPLVGLSSSDSAAVDALVVERVSGGHRPGELTTRPRSAAYIAAIETLEGV